MAFVELIFHACPAGMAELRVLIVCFCFLFYFRGSRLWLRAACTTRFAHSMHASTFADSLLAAATETFTKLACVCVCHDTPFFDRAVEQGVQARANAVGARRWGTVDLGPGARRDSRCDEGG